MPTDTRPLVDHIAGPRGAALCGRLFRAPPSEDGARRIPPRLPRSGRMPARGLQALGEGRWRGGRPGGSLVGARGPRHSSRGLATGGTATGRSDVRQP